MNHLTIFAYTPHEPAPPGGYVGYINVARAEDGSLRVMVRQRGSSRLCAADPPFADTAEIYLPQSEIARLASALHEWPFQVPPEPPQGDGLQKAER